MAPAQIGACMLNSMPVMWNIGTTPSMTSAALTPFQTCDACTLWPIVRCVCMQPLGCPVVPEV